jgi:hypothetical protein
MRPLRMQLPVYMRGLSVSLLPVTILLGVARHRHASIPDLEPSWAPLQPSIGSFFDLPYRHLREHRLQPLHDAPGGLPVQQNLGL